MPQKLPEKWFKYVTSNFLIYNTCWEDPAIDRQLLGINSSSKVLMITSAGENAFDYLLDDPLLIDSVDINPYQNALFELKRSFFTHSDINSLRSFFLTGKSKDYKAVYDSLRSELPDFPRAFWDKNIHWFSENAGFYKKGLTGYFARFLNFLINTKGLRKPVNKLLSQKDESVRKQILESEIYPLLWAGISKHLWKTDFIMALAGIPGNQKNGVTDLNTHMKNVFNVIFESQNVSENYFWRLYLDGEYPASHVPSYLKEENFDYLSGAAGRISTYTSSVKDFLKLSETQYSHFILLDHQDWLVNNGTHELEKEWNVILNTAAPSAKILIRSVYKSEEDLLPDFVKKRLKSIPISNSILKQDRVGTYPSTFLFQTNV